MGSDAADTAFCPFHTNRVARAFMFSLRKPAKDRAPTVGHAGKIKSLRPPTPVPLMYSYRRDVHPVSIRRRIREPSVCPRIVLDSNIARGMLTTFPQK